jgi:hypothetical protein
MKGEIPIKSQLKPRAERRYPRSMGHLDTDTCRTGAAAAAE